MSFVTGSYHQIADLISAILVCSETYEGFSGGLQRGEIERAIKLWQRRLAGGFFGKLKRTLKRAAYLVCQRVERLHRFRRTFLVTPNDVMGFDFVEECRKMERYIDEHGGGQYRINDWSVPDTASRHPEQMPTFTPATELLLSGLVSEVGLSESEALNMPLPKARWTWAIHAERKGWCVIVDTDVRSAAQESANEFARKVAAGEIDPLTLEAKV